MTALPALALLLAQQGSDDSKTPGLFGNPIVMMVLLIVMFYFLLIRPQQKQRKEQQARIASMQTGDRVVTAGGVHGLIHNIKERTVVIKVSEGVMIEFEKTAVSSVTKRESQQEEKK